MIDIDTLNKAAIVCAQAGQGGNRVAGGAADDPRYFQISLPVQPGNSGGALQ
jgi:hypothetical protein